MSIVVHQESWAPEPMCFRNLNLRNELYIFSLKCLYWNCATEQRIRNLLRPYNVGFWRRRLF